MKMRRSRPLFPSAALLLFWHNLTFHKEFSPMSTKTFTVPNISCGHCVHTIQSEVADLAGVTHVQADQNSRQVTVEWSEPASWGKISALLQEINYPPEGLIQLN